jgi:hypothetical protein
MSLFDKLFEAKQGIYCCPTPSLSSTCLGLWSCRWWTSQASTIVGSCLSSTCSSILRISSSPLPQQYKLRHSPQFFQQQVNPPTRDKDAMDSHWDAAFLPPLSQLPTNKDARWPLSMITGTWWWLAEPWSSMGQPGVPSTGTTSMAWPCLLSAGGAHEWQVEARRKA